jgi:hypothetical protein
VQQSDAYIVTVIRPPEREITVSDVLIGSLGVAGAALAAALVLGAVVGGVLVVRHRLWPKDWRPMPPVAPSFSTTDGPPSSQSR